MEAWQYIAGLAFAALVGGFVKEKFFSSPASLAADVAALKSEVAVLQATKASDEKVRKIVHEQLQPLLVVVDAMREEQKKQGDMLARIDERLAKHES